MPASGQVPPHAWAIPIEVQTVPETRFLCTSVLGMRVPVCSVRSRASRAELSHRALNSWAFRLDVEPRFQVEEKITKFSGELRDAREKNGIQPHFGAKIAPKDIKIQNRAPKTLSPNLKSGPQNPKP